MRILIDECLDWRLSRVLSEHQCVSVHQRRWGGITNGMLLEKAQHEFDVFLTGDMNLRFQENLTKFDIAVVVLEARSTRVLEVLKTIQRGQVVCITPDDA